MANGDGFSEVGGGGSVLWRVTEKKSNKPTIIPEDAGPRSRTTTGKDEYENEGPGDHFEIRIKLPDDGRLKARVQGGALFIYVPIDAEDPGPSQSRQIRTSWAVRNLPPGLTDLILPTSASTT
jgi:hypothetical protein